eukprot:scaffold403677_cov37-Prasinocladus_malaysianus.AAC.1
MTTQSLHFSLLSRRVVHSTDIPIRFIKNRDLHVHGAKWTAQSASFASERREEKLMTFTTAKAITYFLLRMRPPSAKR